MTGGASTSSALHPVAEVCKDVPTQRSGMASEVGPAAVGHPQIGLRRGQRAVPKFQYTHAASEFLDRMQPWGC